MVAAFAGSNHAPPGPETFDQLTRAPSVTVAASSTGTLSTPDAVADASVTVGAAPAAATRVTVTSSWRSSPTSSSTLESLNT